MITETEISYVPSEHSVYRPWPLIPLAVGIATVLTGRAMVVNSILEVTSPVTLALLAAGTALISTSMIFESYLKETLNLASVLVILGITATSAVLGWAYSPIATDSFAWSPQQRLSSALLFAVNALCLSWLAISAFTTRRITISHAASAVAVALVIAANSVFLDQNWPAVFCSFFAFIMFLVAWDRTEPPLETEIAARPISVSGQIALSAIAALITVVSLLIYVNKRETSALFLALLSIVTVIGAAVGIALRMRDINSSDFTKELESTTLGTEPSTSQPTTSRSISTRTRQEAKPASGLLSWFRELRSGTFRNEFDQLRSNGDTAIQVGDIAAVTDTLDLPDEFTTPIALAKKKVPSPQEMPLPTPAPNVSSGRFSDLVDIPVPTASPFADVIGATTEITAETAGTAGTAAEMTAGATTLTTAGAATAIRAEPTGDIEPVPLVNPGNSPKDTGEINIEKALASAIATSPGETIQLVAIAVNQTNTGAVQINTGSARLDTGAVSGSADISALSTGTFAAIVQGANRVQPQHDTAATTSPATAKSAIPKSGTAKSGTAKSVAVGAVTNSPWAFEIYDLSNYGYIVAIPAEPFDLLEVNNYLLKLLTPTSTKFTLVHTKSATPLELIRTQIEIALRN